MENEALKGSYRWSVENGRCFQLKHRAPNKNHAVLLSTFCDVEGPLEAIKFFCERHGIGPRFNVEGEIEAYAVLPGSRIGAQIVEGRGRYQLVVRDGEVKVKYVGVL